jgi:hypothetical protein
MILCTHYPISAMATSYKNIVKCHRQDVGIHITCESYSDFLGITWVCVNVCVCVHI